MYNVYYAYTLYPCRQPQGGPADIDRIKKETVVKKEVLSTTILKCHIERERCFTML